MLVLTFLSVLMSKIPAGSVDRAFFLYLTGNVFLNVSLTPLTSE